MFLMFHIASALVSIFFSTLAFLSPSRKKLITSYIFTSTTTISGAGLIFLQEANIIRVCFSGIAYIAVIFYLSKLTKKQVGIPQINNF